MLQRCLMLESQPETTLPEHPRALHITPPLRVGVLSSVDSWAPLCEEPQSRSTTTKSAERLRTWKQCHTGSCPPSQTSADDPLFCLNAAGTLSMSERMAKRLDTAQLGHIGKNIRISTTDAQ
eukprot:scaffold29043_cov112-Isochrysis_galbana.AAC.2